MWHDVNTPLYLRTLWRYTNTVIIIIIITNKYHCIGYCEQQSWFSFTWLYLRGINSDLMRWAAEFNEMSHILPRKTVAIVLTDCKPRCYAVVQWPHT